MKLCPQCNDKCLNSASLCDCGYSFSDEQPKPEHQTDQRAAGYAKFYVQPDPSSLTGPFTIEEIRSKLNSGALSRDSLVQREGDLEWATIADLPNSVGVTEFSTRAKVSNLIRGSASATKNSWAAATADYVGGLVIFVALNLLLGFGSRVGAIVGYIVGLAPLFVDMARQNKTPGTKKSLWRGLIGFICCGIVGAFAGLVGAIPTAAVFWWMIKMAEKRSKD